MSAYRIAVVGAGGVGGYFGGRLAAAGVDTTFVVRGRTLEALRSRGLRVQSVDGDFSVDRVKATDRPTERVDAVLMTVKACQIAEAAANVKAIVGDDTIVVPLENGVDAAEQLASVLPRRNVAGGVCAIVSFIVEPGVIRHAGGSPFIMFGELDNRVTPRAQRLVEALRSAGLKADIAPDIQKSIWSKFVFIAPMSAVGAATRMPVGAWRTVPETRALAERVIGEVIALATARRVAVDADMLEKTMQRIDALQPDATASMQRDVMEGKPSELEAQLGAAVRLAKESGVAAPVLETLYAALLPQERAARGA